MACFDLQPTPQIIVIVQSLTVEITFVRRSSEMSLGLDWELLTDVSGEHTGHILKGQAHCLDCLTLECGTDIFSQTSLINYEPTSRNVPEDVIVAVPILDTTPFFWGERDS